MKSTMILIALLAMTVTGAAALAQGQPGDVGVFFDPAGTQSAGSIQSFVFFDVYVVGFDLPGNVLGYEFSLNLSDPNLVLLSTIYSGPSPINAAGTPLNVIVGAGGCFSGAGPTVLATYTFGEFTGLSPSDLLFCLGPSTPSSFFPAAPGWLTCSSDVIPFQLAQNGGGIYPDGCAVGNPSETPPVAQEQESWGAVKALFR